MWSHWSHVHSGWVTSGHMSVHHVDPESNSTLCTLTWHGLHFQKFTKTLNFHLWLNDLFVDVQCSCFEGISSLFHWEIKVQTHWMWTWRVKALFSCVLCHWDTGQLDVKYQRSCRTSLWSCDFHQQWWQIKSKTAQFPLSLSVSHPSYTQITDTQCSSNTQVTVPDSPVQWHSHIYLHNQAN